MTRLIKYPILHNYIDYKTKEFMLGIMMGENKRKAFTNLYQLIKYYRDELQNINIK